ncbi:hypothetical protein Atai01_07690 [Amycolatopsis taiwanensis]|uniref:Uncharacterized protein n=1 Tax=Amycolatopsis taiwanensis TaxID=342230 RepID=A0A9W6QY73_9PSEU|nr:hypothetical protein Atai01_07690 [Amycolatopsis taiwanensis]
MTSSRRETTSIPGAASEAGADPGQAGGGLDEQPDSAATSNIETIAISVRGLMPDRVRQNDRFPPKNGKVRPTPSPRAVR